MSEGHYTPGGTDAFLGSALGDLGALALGAAVVIVPALVVAFTG